MKAHHVFWVMRAVGSLFLAVPAGSGWAGEVVRNRLVVEDTSYLRSQSGSPVDWWAWGPEAFAEAERLGRPVLVSIGYFSCAWTAKMDREVFGDPATAAWLNGEFVNVKVDRLERPEVDRWLQWQVAAGGGRGGWPLVVWLTPDQLFLQAAGVLTAGDDGGGSFLSEARHLSRLWSAEADFLRGRARRELAVAADRAGPGLAGELELDDWLLRSAYGRVLGQVDPVHGGFGRVPKFPSPARLSWVERRWGRLAADSREADEARRLVVTALAGMAGGGLRDHVGGGFFRYALDEAWRRPYFEKLALDQALMAEVFLLGHRMTGREEFAEVVRETLAYATGELGGVEGGFYTAEHCESLPAAGAALAREGAYYVWTREELRRAAGTAADLMEWVFAVRAGGNLPPGGDPLGMLEGANLLSREASLEAGARRLGLPEDGAEKVWADGLAGLREARRLRPRPALDRLIVTQMNAAMISALCRAGVQLGEPSWVERAVRCADFLRAALWEPSTGTLYRCRLDRAPRRVAVAEDYAYGVRALLDLHEATGEGRWLRWADEVQKAFDRHHGDGVGGGYYDGRRAGPDGPAALKAIDDASAFSMNAVAGMNLVRWSVLLQDPAPAEAARRLLGAFALPLKAESGGVAGLWQVAEGILHSPGRVILVGPPGHPAAVAARAVVAGAPSGRWQVLTVGDEETRDWLAARGAVPSMVLEHGLDTPAVFVHDGAGWKKGLIPWMELDKTLRTLR